LLIIDGCLTNITSSEIKQEIIMSGWQKETNKPLFMNTENFESIQITYKNDDSEAKFRVLTVSYETRCYLGNNISGLYIHFGKKIWNGSYPYDTQKTDELSNSCKEHVLFLQMRMSMVMVKFGTDHMRHLCLYFAAKLCHQNSKNF
jgi:hypothetical protein